MKIKNLLVLSLTMLLMVFVHGQSKKYEQSMVSNINLIDSAFVKGGFADLSAKFERIAKAEKTQWLPYYYAAFCAVMDAINQQDKTKIDAIADKAEDLLNQSEAILKDDKNSEILVIKSMIASAHMSVDPTSRWVQYGNSSNSNMQKAKQLDLKNPRPIYLEAIQKYLTPEQFGGSKVVAKKLFEQTLTMVQEFVPKTKLHPNWCSMGAQYYLALYSQDVK
jgi:hypothetical protein